MQGGGGGGGGNTNAGGQVDLSTKRCTVGPNIWGASVGEVATRHLSGA